MYEGMEELKKVQLEMLLEVDRICEKNNIKYQLFSGTLLGAVRHKGFIPWDDDIDICMLRKDYDKFMEICKKDLDGRYFLQNYETDKEFIHNITRIRKNNTLALQEIWSELDMHHGIFIDIFPMDNIMPDKVVGKLQRYLLYVIKKIKSLKVKSIAYNSRYIALKYTKIIIHNILKPISIQSINRLENKLVCMFKGKNTSKSSCLADSFTNVYYSYMINNVEFYDTVEMLFEGYYFPAPRNYHDVLTNNFGDYMTPPPPEQQKPHHGIIEVCFDTSKNQGGIANE